MNQVSTEWTKWAQKLTGPHFAHFQTQLTKYNAARFLSQAFLKKRLPIC